MTRRELAAQAQEGATQLGEAGRRVVGHLGAREDGAADGGGHLGGVAYLGRSRREPRGAFHPGRAVRDLDPPFDERGHVHERQGLEVQARHPGPRQDLGDVRQVVVGLSPQPGQEAYALGGEGLKVSHRAQVDGRPQGQDVLAATGRPRLLHEQGPDLLELEVAEGMSVQSFQTNIEPSAT